MTKRILEYNSDDMIDVYGSLFREGEPYDFVDILAYQKWVIGADKVLKVRKLVGMAMARGYS